jgi:hypothetical protein
MREGGHVVMLLWTKNHLGNAVAVAKVNKDDATMVPAGVHPAAKDGVHPGI